MVMFYDCMHSIARDGNNIKTAINDDSHRRPNA